MRRRILVIVLAVLLCISGTVHLIGLRQVHVAKDTLNAERLKNESLLSEKLGVEKSFNKLKQEMQLVEESNASALTKLDQLTGIIGEKEMRLEQFVLERTKMKGANARLQKQIDSLTLQMMANKSEAMTEKRRLEDSIRYLIDFSESLSAELNGKMNQ